MQQNQPRIVMGCGFSYLHTAATATSSTSQFLFPLCMRGIFLTASTVQKFGGQSTAASITSSATNCLHKSPLSCQQVLSLPISSNLSTLAPVLMQVPQPKPRPPARGPPRRSPPLMAMHRAACQTPHVRRSMSLAQSLSGKCLSPGRSSRTS